jgi:serine phosphatase RsbU (regulator of sigma subunit)
LDIAARYVPMAAVAGDFYDFIVVDERRVGIIVANVTDHGVPTALIASMLKSALAAQSAHAAESAKVLSGRIHGASGRVQELTNFFERRVYAYQVAVKGESGVP